MNDICESQISKDCTGMNDDSMNEDCTKCQEKKK
ncbi:hypothetical protein LCGC14_0176510 [marine sediment metagenome]|uniref:Uncharacterized protein n=1 Tax=marine sediment metagenome TaxID=412755 RepID=A0A0F9V7W9_9ZZZZ